MPRLFRRSPFAVATPGHSAPVEDPASGGSNASAELSFAGERSSAGAARRFTSETLVAWSIEPLTDALELLVSELVTNVIVHTGGGGTLRIVDGDRQVRVEVIDTSPALPVVKGYGAEATTGRGLQILDLLAQEWGTSVLADGGKCVWATVSVHATLDDALAEPSVVLLDDPTDLDAVSALFGDVSDDDPIAADPEATPLALLR